MYATSKVTISVHRTTVAAVIVTFRGDGVWFTISVVWIVSVLLIEEVDWVQNVKIVMTENSMSARCSQLIVKCMINVMIITVLFFKSHQKRGVNLALLILGVISPFFA